MKPGIVESWPRAIVVAIAGLLAWTILIALVIFVVRLIR